MKKKFSKNKSFRGEGSSISSAYIKHRSFLEKFIYRFFSNKEDVEDVVQETYLRAYVAEQKVEISKHKSFLFTTARNIALSKLTEKANQVTDFLEDYSRRNDLGNDPTPDELLDAQQQLTIYCVAVDTLHGKCREAFLLKKVHGMTHNEIAKHMSLSRSSVDKYLHRAILSCNDYILKLNSNGPAAAPTEVLRKMLSETTKK